MTDADLTLRDEVAEVLLRKFQTPETAWAKRDLWQNALEDADALMPLLARVREEAWRASRLDIAAELRESGAWSELRMAEWVEMRADRAALAEPTGEPK